MMNTRWFKVVLSGVVFYLALITGIHAQPGAIIEGNSTVLDPNNDRYITNGAAGFMGDDYDVDEFEIPMFGIPIFGDGEAYGDTQVGPSCGTTDITLDKFGFGVYATLDGSGNLIFRFRLANQNPGVEGYSILIDTDQLMGDADPNSTSENPGFEVAITLIQKKEVRLLNIDGISSCPDPLEIYPSGTHQQKSYAGTANCGDGDFFLDFYIPFADLQAHFGISTSSLLRFAAATNISATCPVDGTISDVGGVDDTNYPECPICAFLDLTLNQCPTPMDFLCAGCGGFPSGPTIKPAIDQPVSQGNTTISGTSEPEAQIFINIFNATGTLSESIETLSDINGAWNSGLLTNPLQPLDSITVDAQAVGKCKSGTTGEGVAYIIVTGNDPPVITGTTLPLGYLENSGRVQIDTVKISDSDNLQLMQAQVSIAGGYLASEDLLHYDPVAGISGIYEATTATWTLTGAAPLTAYETALRQIYYENTSENPDLAIRTIRFVVHDGTQYSAPFTRNILMVRKNDKPEILIDGNPADEIVRETNEDTPLDLCLDYLDPEGDLGAIDTWQSLDGQGLVEIQPDNNLCFTYFPAPDFFGEEIIRIFLCDDGMPQACDSLTIKMIVHPVNDAPVIVENAVPVDTVFVTLPEDQSVTGCITVLDVDNDVVEITAMDPGPTHSNNTVFNGLCFEYQPEQNFYGLDLFTVKACDTGSPQLCDSVVVQVTVENVNDPPRIVESGADVDTIFAEVNQLGLINLCLEVKDIDGDETFLESTQAAAGLGSIADVNDAATCFSFLQNGATSGTEMIYVTVCDSGSPSLCDSAVIVVSLQDWFPVEPELTSVIVYEAVSPNGDGLNDTWIIQNIGRYPANRVQIFDRWNNLVYEQTGYNNSDRSWQGESNQAGAGKALPEGTYFYILDLGDHSPARRGYIVLKR